MTALTHTRAQSRLLRHGRAALALSLAALAPGLGHLSLGRWVKGAVLLVANTVALGVAGQLLLAMVPDYRRLDAAQAAALLSGEQLLVLTGVTLTLIACIFYSVHDVRRVLRQL